LAVLADLLTDDNRRAALMAATDARQLYELIRAFEQTMPQST
jgi:mannitol/fructose-specific phosphotransferase system IIA component (Ntr-type)